MDGRLRLIEDNAIKAHKERETRQNAEDLLGFLGFDDVNDWDSVT